MLLRQNCTSAVRNQASGSLGQNALSTRCGRKKCTTFLGVVIGERGGDAGRGMARAAASKWALMGRSTLLLCVCC